MFLIFFCKFSMQLKVILKFEGVSKVSRHLKIIFSSKIFLFASKKNINYQSFCYSWNKTCDSGKCLFGETSVRGNVIRGTVNRGNVRSGNCPFTTCPSGNVFGELPVGEISIGQKFAGETFKLLLLLQIGNISSLFIFCLTETKCTIYDTAPSVMW